MSDIPSPVSLQERIERMSVPATLRDGSQAWIGPLLPADRETLAREYETLSEKSRWRRFLSAVPHLTSGMLDQLVDDVDGSDHIALVAFVLDDGAIVPVGIGRIVRYPDHPDTADLALTVKDDFQGRGIAGALAEKLVAQKPIGVTRVLTEVAADNPAPMAIMRRLGEVRVLPIADGAVEVELDLSGAGFAQSRPLVRDAANDAERERLRLGDRVCDELARLVVGVGPAH